MPREKLYAVAISAMKTDVPGELIEGDGERGDFYRFALSHHPGGDINTELGMMAGVERAVSQEEAERLAMIQALTFWPKTEGWAVHLVRSDVINDGLILEAADMELSTWRS
ncbi:MAG: hypothetical protein ACRD9R_14860 [Pyrinomonadaceae bacterium]